MKRAWRAAWLFTVVLAACASAGVNERASEDVNRSNSADAGFVAARVTAARTLTDIPGLAVLVWKDGALHAFAEGERIRGSHVHVTADDLWHIGSLAKPMTATLFAREVKAGRLDFDTPLLDMFPEWKQKAGAGWADVTMAQLLTHTAGIVDPEGYDAFSLGDASPLDLPSRRYEMARRLVMQPLGHPAGELHHYSNLGYLILGAVLERVSGTDFETRMRAEVFVPLGMTGAGFGVPGSANSSAYAWGHEEGEGGRAVDPRVEQHLVSPEITPAGDVHASLSDLLAFARLHLAAARGESTDTYLEAASLVRLHALPEGELSGYASGWLVRKSAAGGTEILTHEGSDGFWIADLLIQPKDNLIVIIVANRYDHETVRVLRRELVTHFR